MYSVFLFRSNISYGCSLEVNGKLHESKGKQQDVELCAENVTVLGLCDSKVNGLNTCYITI